MKKLVNVGGTKMRVEYKVLDSVLMEDNSTPSKKYSNTMNIDRTYKETILIDGKEYSSLRRFTQNGGGYSEKWLGKNNVWVNSEKKLIESLLN